MPHGHKDLKTIISISRYAAFVVAKFPQGTLFFMPWEVHSCQRLRENPPIYQKILHFSCPRKFIHARG